MKSKTNWCNNNNNYKIIFSTIGMRLRGKTVLDLEVLVIGNTYE